MTTKGRFQINRRKTVNRNIAYLLAVHNFLNINRCIYKIGMVSTHSCLNIAFSSFSSISSIADCERQQQTLTNLHYWSHDNNLRFNVSKCKVLPITRKKKPLLQDFLLGPEKVHHVHEEKDLGVVISDKLT